ncbi:MAG: DUF6702 family protein [Flavobacteriaceae bacterium]
MKKISILFIVVSLLSFTIHKYHLSNTKVIYNSDKETIQITMRYFVDDMETAINTKENLAIELGTKIEHDSTDVFLNNYVKSHFNIHINETLKTYNYIGREIEKDIIYLYIEVEKIPTVHSIQIENTFLLSDFDDQKNVIKLSINNKKKTFILKNGTPKKSISYK